MDTAGRIEALERSFEAARRRSRWLMAAFVVAIAACLLAGAAQVAEPPGRGKGLIQEVSEGVVQCGMIIPYCGEDLPPGYRWCNGNDSKDYPNQDNVFPKDASWVPLHLRGKPLPDLNGRFLRGVGATEMVGHPDGKDSATGFSTANEGQHPHTVNLPTKTGRITEGEQGTNAGIGPGQSWGCGYNVVMPSGEYKYGMHLPVSPPASGVGNHAHYYLDGGTVSTVDSEGKHEHSLPEIPTVPCYVAVKYIIRVR